MPRRSETYLHGHHDSVLRSHRWRTAENSAGYLLPRLAPGARVLDVGCGPGTITADLAARVPSGQVVGDRRGRRRGHGGAAAEAERRGQANVRFETGDVYQLAFEDGTFDVVHAHQVLQHLSDPVAALAEMRRVCRPGGAGRRARRRLRRLVLVSRRTRSWPSGRPCTGTWPGRWAASRTPGGTCCPGRRAAGFADVAASASAWCYTGPADRPWWGELWAQRLTESPFGDRAVEHGLATRADLERLARAWRRWAEQRGRLVLHPARRDPLHRLAAAWRSGRLR